MLGYRTQLKKTNIFMLNVSQIMNNQQSPCHMIESELLPDCLSNGLDIGEDSGLWQQTGQRSDSVLTIQKTVCFPFGINIPKIRTHHVKLRNCVRRTALMMNPSCFFPRLETACPVRLQCQEDELLFINTIHRAVLASSFSRVFHPFCLLNVKFTMCYGILIQSG